MPWQSPGCILHAKAAIKSPLHTHGNQIVPNPVKKLVLQCGSVKR